MADNFISYNRFSTQPANIADYGTTLEEVRLQRGSPDKNPAVAPMALPRLSQLRLGLRRGGSDRERLGLPEADEEDPFEGPPSLLRLSRRAQRKLKGGLTALLRERLAGRPDSGEASAQLDAVEALLGQLTTTHRLGDVIESTMAASRRN